MKNELKKIIVMEKEFKDEVLTKELERLLDLKDEICKKIDEVQKEKSDLLDSTVKKLQELDKEGE
mgnify:CR=1 FL=1